MKGEEYYLSTSQVFWEQLHLAFKRASTGTLRHLLHSSHCTHWCLSLLNHLPFSLIACSKRKKNYKTVKVEPYPIWLVTKYVLLPTTGGSCYIFNISIIFFSIKLSYPILASEILQTRPTMHWVFANVVTSLILQLAPTISFLVIF